MPSASASATSSPARWCAARTTRATRRTRPLSALDSPPAGLRQHLEWCDGHQVLDGAREFVVEGDQGIGLKLGERDVLGDEGVGPSQLLGDPPRHALEPAVTEKPDPQPTHVVELPLRILPRQFALSYGLVERGQHL